MGWCRFAMLVEAQLWDTLINCVWHRCGRYLAMLWFTPIGGGGEANWGQISLICEGGPHAPRLSQSKFAIRVWKHCVGVWQHRSPTFHRWNLSFSVSSSSFFLILNLVCECVQINYSHYSLHSSSGQNQTALPSLSHRWPLSYTHQCSITPSS